MITTQPSSDLFRRPGPDPQLALDLRPQPRALLDPARLGALPGRFGTLMRLTGPIQLAPATGGDLTTDRATMAAQTSSDRRVAFPMLDPDTDLFAFIHRQRVRSGLAINRHQHSLVVGIRPQRGLRQPSRRCRSDPRRPISPGLKPNHDR
jgi:hypothetical protein